MRLARADARRIAREFRRGRGRAWAWIADRDLLVDAEVMEQVRAAYAADSVQPVTPAQLIEFRSMLVDELARRGYVP